MHINRDLEALAIALSERDSYTEQHCERVTEISLQLGRQCRLPGHELKLLRASAMLHDIGKIGIPDRILLKPGRFEDDEWEIMKTHPLLGQRICEAIPHIESQAVGAIVRHHHEHFDGSGYPDALAGEAIPIHARIIALADGYDAMTTARPYHRPRPHNEIMHILQQECGVKYDPYLYQRLCDFIDTSPWRAPGQ